jgi:N-acetylmuramoyl-L-alanine amidase
LIPSRKFAAVLVAVLAAAAAIAFSVHAQPQGEIPMPEQPPSLPASLLNHNLVVLDPAHGGPDGGAVLGDHILEKDVTLALEMRLRTALSAAGFTVVATRDADPADPLTADQRAEIANRTHAVACIVLHATATGSGVHIYTSTLQPSLTEDAGGDFSSAFVPVPWETAQAGFVSQSQRLSGDLSSVFSKGSIPTLAGKAAVAPLDNLMCPAVTIELAPLPVPGEDPAAVTDANYQQRVAEALTEALQAWRDHADPIGMATPASAEDSAQSKAIAAAEAAGLAAARARSQAGATARPAQKGTQ